MTGPRPSTSTPTWARASAAGPWATTTPCWTSSPAPTWPAASTPATRRSCGGRAQRAAERGVAIGAQVAYRDLAGFGRRFIDVEPDDLTDDVLYQLGALDGLRAGRGRPGPLRQAARRALQRDRRTTRRRPRRWSRRSAAYDPTLPVLGLPGSVWLQAAEAAGLRTVSEAFADRALHARGHAGLAPAARRGAARPGRGRPRACVADGDREHESSAVDGVPRPGRGPTRSACTATPPARSAMAPAVRPWARATAGVQAATRSSAEPGCGSCRAGTPGPAGRGLGPRRGPGRCTPRCGDGPARGVVDLVPAARTPDRCGSTRPRHRTLARVAVQLRRRRAATGQPPACRPAGRDARSATTAQDLAEVARADRARPRSVVAPARRAGVDGRVLRLRPRLRLPRPAPIRPAARCRAAAPRGPRCRPRSVGLAGEFTGVYPRESPGGWQLIGHTDVDALGPRPRPAGAAGARDAGSRFVEA